MQAAGGATEGSAAQGLSAGQRVLRQEAEALLRLAGDLDSRFGKALDLLAHATGRVIVTGMGKSGHIACKIAAKLVRTFTDRHGLKDLCKELLGIDLSKQQQTSDWGAETLLPEQLKYAASDVLYLHQLKAKLDPVLEREGRRELAESCFAFLPTRATLDRMGWSQPDIFEH